MPQLQNNNEIADLDMQNWYLLILFSTNMKLWGYKLMNAAENFTVVFIVVTLVLMFNGGRQA